MRYPITALDPMPWLVAPGDADYDCFSVDGFVTTERKTITALFQRFEYRGTDGRLDAEELLEVLRTRYSTDLIGAVYLAELLNCPNRVFVWPENYPKGYPADVREIISIQPEMIDGVLRLDTYQMVDLKSLAGGIEILRDRSFKTVKPLLSASSNVECYLANATANPWPGDLDAVLVDKASGDVLALVEFKTHNRDSPIEDEAPGKYGQQDWRRFEVLYGLQDRLQAAQGTRPSLWYLAWGTQDVANHRRIKLARIEGNKVIEELLLERPAFGDWSAGLSERLVRV